jgi:hypothetical protein
MTDPQEDVITITYNRATGDVQIGGQNLRVTPGANLPIHSPGPVQFEAILIYHPGCIWFRGSIIC